jgi:hypothetical protein
MSSLVVSENYGSNWSLPVVKLRIFLSFFLHFCFYNNLMEESTAGPSRNNTDISINSNSTRIVRVHWLKFLFYSWKRISNLSKSVVTCYILLVILQVNLFFFPSCIRLILYYLGCYSYCYLSHFYR